MKPNKQFQIAGARKSTILSFSNGSKRILINNTIIDVTDRRGKRKPLRGILDSTRESFFLSVTATDALGLKKEKRNIPIWGLNDSSLNIKKKVSAHQLAFSLSYKENNSQWKIDLLIVPMITDLMPIERD